MDSLEVATRRENSYPTSRTGKKKHKGTHSYLNEGEIKEKREIQKTAARREPQTIRLSTEGFKGILLILEAPQESVSGVTDGMAALPDSYEGYRPEVRRAWKQRQPLVTGCRRERRHNRKPNKLIREVLE